MTKPRRRWSITTTTAALAAAMMMTTTATTRLPSTVNAFHHQSSSPSWRWNGGRLDLDSLWTLSSSMEPSSTAAAWINIDETANRDIWGMDEWANQCGVQRSSGFELVIQDQEENGRPDVSVLTSKDLPAQSPVLWVPGEMILSSDRVYQEFGGYLEEAEKLLQSLNILDQRRHFVLMLKILVEYEKGDQSPWFPWLNSLPRYFSNGASMTPFCFECLPPYISKLAMAERTRLMKMKNLQKVPFLSDETKNNQELISWAYQIVYTRAFDYDAITNNNYENDDETMNENQNEIVGDLCIVPVADYFNHASVDLTEITISIDDEGNCLAQTTCDVPAGSPLRIRYGDPTNPSFLLARYGFLDESSSATFCKLLYPHVNQPLKDMGYAHNRMLFYHETGEVSSEVWDVLLYQMLGSNAARRRELYQAHMNGDDATKYRMHEQFFGETCQQLLHHLDMTVLELDELSAKTYDKDVRDHPRLPLILRHNDFVRQTFLRVRARYFE